MNQQEFIEFLEENFPLIELMETKGQTLFGGEYGYDQAEIRKGRTFHIFNDYKGKPIDIHFNNISKEEIIKEMIKAGFTYAFPEDLKSANEILKHHIPEGWDLYWKKNPKLILEEFTGEELIMRFSYSKNTAIVLIPIYKNVFFDPDLKYTSRGIFENGVIKISRVYEEGEDYNEEY